MGPRSSDLLEGAKMNKQFIALAKVIGEHRVDDDGNESWVFESTDTLSAFVRVVVMHAAAQLPEMNAHVPRYHDNYSQGVIDCIEALNDLVKEEDNEDDQ